MLAAKPHLHWPVLPGISFNTTERETRGELSCFYGREGVTQLTHILLGPSQAALPQVALPQVALPQVPPPPRCLFCFWGALGHADLERDVFE